MRNKGIINKRLLTSNVSLFTLRHFFNHYLQGRCKVNNETLDVNNLYYALVVHFVLGFDIYY